MIYLVDLDEAKTRLRLDDQGEAFDDELQTLILQASAIVLDYCNTITVPDDISPAVNGIYQITDDPVEREVIRAGVFRVLANLYENRESGEVLDATVMAMLHRFRDPVLA